MFDYTYFSYGSRLKLVAPNLINFWSGVRGEWSDDIESAYLYVPNATNLSSAFFRRTHLANISGTFSNATDISDMCYGCPSLNNTVYTPKAINMAYTYSECYGLRTATFPPNV